ncbi:hypothetical protein JW933_10515, partial [candidate division FCPU426 bacterium]|nr:hypothetical protein [candidate division FCPU426 bacterium]
GFLDPSAGSAELAMAALRLAWVAFPLLHLFTLERRGLNQTEKINAGLATLLAIGNLALSATSAPVWLVIVAGLGLHWGMNRLTALPSVQRHVPTRLTAKQSVIQKGRKDGSALTNDAVVSAEWVETGGVQESSRRGFIIASLLFAAGAVATGAAFHPEWYGQLGLFAFLALAAYSALKAVAVSRAQQARERAKTASSRTRKHALIPLLWSFGRFKVAGKDAQRGVLDKVSKNGQVLIADTVAYLPAYFQYTTAAHVLMHQKWHFPEALAYLLEPVVGLGMAVFHKTKTITIKQQVKKAKAKRQGTFASLFRAQISALAQITWKRTWGLVGSTIRALQTGDWARIGLGAAAIGFGIYAFTAFTLPFLGLGLLTGMGMVLGAILIFLPLQRRGRGALAAQKAQAMVFRIGRQVVADLTTRGVTVDNQKKTLDIPQDIKFQVTRLPRSTWGSQDFTRYDAKQGLVLVSEEFVSQNDWGTVQQAIADQLLAVFGDDSVQQVLFQRFWNEQYSGRSASQLVPVKVATQFGRLANDSNSRSRADGWNELLWSVRTTAEVRDLSALLAQFRRAATAGEFVSEGQMLAVLASLLAAGYQNQDLARHVPRLVKKILSSDRQTVLSKAQIQAAKLAGRQAAGRQMTRTLVAQPQAVKLEVLLLLAHPDLQLSSHHPGETRERREQNLRDQTIAFYQDLATLVKTDPAAAQAKVRRQLARTETAEGSRAFANQLLSVLAQEQPLLAAMQAAAGKEVSPEFAAAVRDVESRRRAAAADALTVGQLHARQMRNLCLGALRVLAQNPELAPYMQVSRILIAKAAGPRLAEQENLIIGAQELKSGLQAGLAAYQQARLAQIQDLRNQGIITRQGLNDEDRLCEETWLLRQELMNIYGKDQGKTRFSKSEQNQALSYIQKRWKLQDSEMARVEALFQPLSQGLEFNITFAIEDLLEIIRDSGQRQGEYLTIDFRRQGKQRGELARRVYKLDQELAGTRIWARVQAHQDARHAQLRELKALGVIGPAVTGPAVLAEKAWLLDQELTYLYSTKRSGGPRFTPQEQADYLACLAANGRVAEPEASRLLAAYAGRNPEDLLSSPQTQRLLLRVVRDRLRLPVDFRRKGSRIIELAGQLTALSAVCRMGLTAPLEQEDQEPASGQEQKKAAAAEEKDQAPLNRKDWVSAARQDAANYFQRLGWNLPWSLMSKIMVTIGIIGLYFLLSQLPLPGVNVDTFVNILPYSGNAAQMMVSITNFKPLFFAFGWGPVFLGNMIMGVLVMLVPSLQEMQKSETESKKIRQWGRRIAVGIALAQACLMVYVLPGVFLAPAVAVAGIITLTAGTMLMNWFMGQLEKHGLGGRGTSLLFAAMGVPALIQVFVGSWILGGFLWAVLGALVIVALSLILNLKYKNIAIRSKRDPKVAAQAAPRARKLSLQLDYFGITAAMGASALIGLLTMLSPAIMGAALAPMTLCYIAVVIALILGFSILGTRILFKPEEVAKRFMASGDYIPGTPEGRATQDYFARQLKRLPVIGGLIIALIVLAPQAVNLDGMGISLLLLVTGLVGVWDQVKALLAEQRMRSQAAVSQKASRTVVGRILPYVVPPVLVAVLVKSLLLLVQAGTWVFATLNILLMTGAASWLSFIVGGLIITGVVVFRLLQRRHQATAGHRILSQLRTQADEVDDYRAQYTHLSLGELGQRSRRLQASFRNISDPEARQALFREKRAQLIALAATTIEKQKRGQALTAGDPKQRELLQKYHIHANQIMAALAFSEIREQRGVKKVIQAIRLFMQPGTSKLDMVGYALQLATGQGKSNAAAMCLFAMSMLDAGAKLSTPNIDLALRDAKEVAELLAPLGLSLAVVGEYDQTLGQAVVTIWKNGKMIKSTDRSLAYEADIIYGTEAVFNHDYQLRVDRHRPFFRLDDEGHVTHKIEAGIPRSISQPSYPSLTDRCYKLLLGALVETPGLLVFDPVTETVGLSSQGRAGLAKLARQAGFQTLPQLQEVEGLLRTNPAGLRLYFAKLVSQVAENPAYWEAQIDPDGQWSALTPAGEAYVKRQLKISSERSLTEFKAVQHYLATALDAQFLFVRIDPETGARVRRAPAGAFEYGVILEKNLNRRKVVMRGQLGQYGYALELRGGKQQALQALEFLAEQDPEIRASIHFTSLSDYQSQLSVAQYAQRYSYLHYMSATIDESMGFVPVALPSDQAPSLVRDAYGDQMYINPDHQTQALQEMIMKHHALGGILIGTYSENKLANLSRALLDALRAQGGWRIEVIDEKTPVEEVRRIRAEAESQAMEIRSRMEKAASLRTESERQAEMARIRQEHRLLVVSLLSAETDKSLDAIRKIAALPNVITCTNPRGTMGFDAVGPDMLAIEAEVPPSASAQQQLFGRVARQGLRGFAQYVYSLADDDILLAHGRQFVLDVVEGMKQKGRKNLLGDLEGETIVRYIQSIHHAIARNEADMRAYNAKYLQPLDPGDAKFRGLLDSIEGMTPAELDAFIRASLQHTLDDMAAPLTTPGRVRRQLAQLAELVVTRYTQAENPGEWGFAAMAQALQSFYPQGRPDMASLLRGSQNNRKSARNLRRQLLRRIQADIASPSMLAANGFTLLARRLQETGINLGPADLKLLQVQYQRLLSQDHSLQNQKHFRNNLVQAAVLQYQARNRDLAQQQQNLVSQLQRAWGERFLNPLEQSRQDVNSRMFLQNRDPLMWYLHQAQKVFQDFFKAGVPEVVAAAAVAPVLPSRAVGETARIEVQAPVVAQEVEKAKALPEAGPAAKEVFSVIPESAEDSTIYQMALAGNFRQIGGDDLHSLHPSPVQIASFGPVNQPVVVVRINDPGRISQDVLHFMRSVTLSINRNSQRVIVVVGGGEQAQAKHGGRINQVIRALQADARLRGKISAYRLQAAGTLQPAFRTWRERLAAWALPVYVPTQKFKVSTLLGVGFFLTGIAVLLVASGWVAGVGCGLLVTAGIVLVVRMQVQEHAGIPGFLQGSTQRAFMLQLFKSKHLLALPMLLAASLALTACSWYFQGQQQHLAMAQTQIAAAPVSDQTTAQAAKPAAEPSLEPATEQLPATPAAKAPADSSRLPLLVLMPAAALISLALLAYSRLRFGNRVQRVDKLLQDGRPRTASAMARQLRIPEKKMQDVLNFMVSKYRRTWLDADGVKATGRVVVASPAT